jgi:hypothetical protein
MAKKRTKTSDTKTSEFPRVIHSDVPPHLIPIRQPPREEAAELIASLCVDHTTIEEMIPFYAQGCAVGKFTPEERADTEMWTERMVNALEFVANAMRYLAQSHMTAIQRQYPDFDEATVHAKQRQLHRMHAEAWGASEMD